MPTLDELKAQLAAAREQLNADQNALDAARTRYITESNEVNRLSGDVVNDQQLVTTIETAIANYVPPVSASAFTFGFWDDGPSVQRATELRRTVGLGDVKALFVRERTGVALGDPLVRESLPAGVNWLRATEIDPRVGDSHGYIDYHKAVTDPVLRAHIVRQTKEAANLPPGSYVEVNSEFHIDKHAPAGYSLVQRQAGCIEFAMFVLGQLKLNAPKVKRVTSATQGLFNSNNYGPPELWLPPQVLDLLDGIGVDGYSKAWTAKPRTGAAWFDNAIAWATAHGKPTYITEWGVQEHKGTSPDGTDGGTGKAAEYAAFATYFKSKASKDGGKTGLVHVMCNTDHDEPGAPDIAQWDPASTPKALAAFKAMVTAA